MVSKQCLEDIVKDFSNDENIQNKINNIYIGNVAKEKIQIQFFNLFGCVYYKSIDPFDLRSDYDYDLNYKINHKKKFDVVLNIGTGEHIFNVFQFFENIHELLNKDGISVHIAPAYGDINHGFYNFHPILWKKLAQANKYNILYFFYIDDFGTKTKRETSIKKFDMDKNALFSDNKFDSNRETLSKLFYENYIKNSKNENIDEVFDYCLVVLQKTNTSKFVIPSQHGNVVQNSFIKNNSFRYLTYLRRVHIRLLAKIVRTIPVKYLKFIFKYLPEKYKDYAKLLYDKCYYRVV